MAIESAADRAMFLDADEFGVTATYRKYGTATDIPITGIFDAEHSVGAIGGDIEIASVSPQFLARSADLPSGAADRDSVTVDGTAYKVRFVEPDGTGMTVLKLEKA